jgi:hypothetical protein
VSWSRYSSNRFFISAGVTGEPQESKASPQIANLDRHFLKTGEHLTQGMDQILAKLGGQLPLFDKTVH